ncbi:MAG: ribonuclease P protein component [Acidimicrobiales bacterium]
MIRSIGDRSTFAALRRRGRRARSGPLWVRHLPGSGDEPTRVGYAIGRQVGNAVVRNRLRRRLRAVLSEMDHDGSIPPGVYLVGADPSASDASFEELRARMQRVVSKLQQVRS